MSSRRSVRIGRPTKRSLRISSPPTSGSSCVQGSTKRHKHPYVPSDLDPPENENLRDNNSSAAASTWIPTNKLPPHLIGNKYFDENHNKQNKKENENETKNGITLLHRTNTPEDFSLSQAICSYGYFCLAPNRWVPGNPRSSDDEDGTAVASDGRIGRGPGDDEGYLVRPLTWYQTTGATPCHENETTKTRASRTVRVAIGQDPTTGSVLVAIDDSGNDGGSDDDDDDDDDDSSVIPNRDNTNTNEDDDDRLDQLTAQIDRMLRLDTSLEAFHAVCPEAKERGFGRLYRSPTLFEDIVKTITNCNMTWGGTVEMNARLCRHVGRDGAFPTPSEIFAVGPGVLRERCRVGYRAAYIWAFARDVAEGTLDPARDLGADPNGRRRHARGDVRNRLRQLTGIGPFAADNILQLMGYSDAHPYDTETVRLWKEDFGASKSATKSDVFASARAHYSRYEPFEFTAYWYDLWKNYERRAGARSPRWSIEQCETERPPGIESDHNSVFAHPPSKSKRAGRKKKKK